MHSGRCPKCDWSVSRVDVENVTINAGSRVSYKGVTYLCPSCHSVLGVSMDQIALNEDLKTRLLKALGRG
jgi:hypothetical protein